MTIVNYFLCNWIKNCLLVRKRRNCCGCDQVLVRKGDFSATDRQTFQLFYIQDFHLCQVPEGSISQFADAVPLQLEHLQTGQTLKGQTLHLTDTVPIQFTAGWTDKDAGKSVRHLGYFVTSLKNIPTFQRLKNGLPSFYIHSSITS